MEVDKPGNIEFSIEFRALARGCFTNIKYSVFFEQLKKIVSKNKFLQEHCNDDNGRIYNHRDRIVLYVKEILME